MFVKTETGEVYKTFEAELNEAQRHNFILHHQINELKHENDILRKESEIARGKVKEFKRSRDQRIEEYQHLKAKTEIALIERDYLENQVERKKARLKQYRALVRKLIAEIKRQDERENELWDWWGNYQRDDEWE